MDGPPQGLSEAQRAGEVFSIFLVNNPPRGYPFEGRGRLSHLEKYEKKSRIIPE